MDALRTRIGSGFHIVNLNSIELVVRDDNARARRCYEKLRFPVVARKRQTRTLGERRLDVLVMDLLAEEFTAPSPIPPLAGKGASPDPPNSHALAFRPSQQLFCRSRTGWAKVGTA